MNDSSFNLHFGINAEELTGQYGRHSSDAELPIFVAQDGYIRVMPRQGIDHGESTRRDDLTGINLDNLFGLLNIVVVENERIEASIEISKKVIGDAPDGDVYQFAIKLTAPKDEPTKNLQGIYNAYTHKTGHQLPILDENGKQVTIDGVPQYSGPCAPADMEEDGHTPLYLYVDANGDAWIMADRNSTPPDAESNLSRLTLKNGETYVILGLPEGTGFSITEAITTASGGNSQAAYNTSIEIDDYMTEDPEYTVNEAERNVTGALNSADPDDEDADITSVKVLYINTISNTDPNPDQVVLPEVGGTGTAIFCIAGGLLLIGTAMYLLLIRRKRTAR